MAGLAQTSNTRYLIILVALVLLPLAVYWQVGEFDFVSLDDPGYVHDNPRVTAGLSSENLPWAFTSNEEANWHPLVWLSLMLDSDLHGVDAGGFHRTNLWLHVVNGLLLFAALCWMTGEPWKSGFVAALFAVHPLHVESVAWIASRKDVLSTLFGLIALIGYVGFVRRRRVAWYLVALVAYACSLMSKQMLVTLPFVLLLLDYWPLQRWTPKAARQGVGRLVVEKLPFFALAFAFSIVAYLAQQRGGAVQDFEQFPAHVRLLNAIVVYVLYMWHTVWPQGLAVQYPHPQSAISMVHVLGAAGLLLVASFAAIRQADRHPYLPVGWAWYLGTLVPVIGLVQVGSQQMADRYTYIPIVGLFIVTTWFVTSIAPAGFWRERALPSLAVAVLLALAVIAWTQTGFWRNSVVLYERAIAATRDNAFAHQSLGTAFGLSGRYDEAIRHFERTVELDPDSVGAHVNLGNVFRIQGRFDDAVARFATALAIDPTVASVHVNWGGALLERDRFEEAIEHFEAALDIAPDDPKIRETLISALRGYSRALARQGRPAEAARHFRRVVELEPDHWLARYDLAVALFLQGDLDEARTQYVKTLEFRPDFAEAHNELGLLLLRQGEREPAADHFREALRLKPDFAPARRNLRDATSD